MASWYVVKTKPRQEEQTAVVLTQRGVKILLPKAAVWAPGQKRAGNKKLEPLFPGYLFARLDIRSQEWLAARSAPGVAYFLGALGVPSPIPAHVVEDIDRRAQEQQRHGWRPRFRPGERLLITDGPLSGFEAVFDGTLSGPGRSRVFVEVLSRLVPVVLPDNLLRRAG